MLTSPKFAATFAVCALLVLLSLALGVSEYRAYVGRQQSAEGLQQQELGEAASWSEVQPRAFRKADPLQIFVAGVHNDVGRFSSVAGSDDIKLQRSVYSDDPILALFRMVDLGFIVTFVLSLFAILFTYDAVSGERETGTLRLVFSNPVPRAKYIVGKLVGIWLGLATPLAMVLLLGLLGVVLSGVWLSAGDWIRIALFMLATALYLSFFVALSLFVSALSRRSSSAFLVLLATWVVLVLVVPRASLTAATHLRPVPSVAEVEGRNAAFESAALTEMTREMTESWKQRSAAMDGLDEEQRTAYEDNNMWQWMEEDEQRQKLSEKRIQEHSRQLSEQLRHQQAAQARLALRFARISPGASFQIAAMTLANTDLGLKARSEGFMRSYQNEMSAFVAEKSGGTAGRRRIVSHSSDSESRLNIIDEDQERVDLTEMPRYLPPRTAPQKAASRVIVDLGLLALLGLLCFAGAVIVFLRADVR